MSERIHIKCKCGYEFDGPLYLCPLYCPHCDTKIKAKHCMRFVHACNLTLTPLPRTQPSGVSRQSSFFGWLVGLNFNPKPKTIVKNIWYNLILFSTYCRTSFKVYLLISIYTSRAIIWEKRSDLVELGTHWSGA